MSSDLGLGPRDFSYLSHQNKVKGLVYRSIGGTAILIFEAIDLRGLGMRLS